MNLKSFCPMVATTLMPETRAFYDWLGFRVVGADPRSVQLAWPEAAGVRIGFILADDPKLPNVFQGGFGGEGVVLQFEVEDIDTLYRRIGAVHTLAVKLREGHAGCRHFAIVDPNGLVLEFVEKPAMAVDGRDRPNHETRVPPGPTPQVVLYPRTAQVSFAR